MIALFQATTPATAPRLSAAAIHDTIAAVFRAPDFNRSSPIERFWDWFWHQLARLWNAIPSVQSPALTILVRVVVVSIVIAVVARVIYALSFERRRAASADDPAPGAAGTSARDPLAVANEAAARGDYTTAAHALYAALLLAISRRERVRLHPSKTVGDYVRDLRARSSAIFARFRDFARSYEVVIYGVGVCDRERYERLYRLAADIVATDGGRRG